MASYVCRCILRALHPQAKRMHYVTLHQTAVSNVRYYWHCINPLHRKMALATVHRKGCYAASPSYVQENKDRRHYSKAVRYKLRGWIVGVRSEVISSLADNKDVFLEKMKKNAARKKPVSSNELLAFIGAAEKEHFPYVFRLYKLMCSKHLKGTDIGIVDVNMMSLFHFHDAVREANAFIDYVISEEEGDGIDSNRNLYPSIAMIYLMLLYKNKEYQHIIDIVPRLTKALRMDIQETGMYYVLSLCSMDTSEAFIKVHEFVSQHYKGSLPKVSILKCRVGMMALKQNEPHLCLEILENCYNEVTIQLRAVASARLGDFQYALALLKHNHWIGKDTLKELLKSIIVYGDKEPEIKEAVVFHIKEYMKQNKKMDDFYVTLENYLQRETDILAYSPSYSEVHRFMV